MEVTCQRCGAAATITDPEEGSDGWQYDAVEQEVIDVATYPDGTSEQRHRKVSIPFARRLTWVCDAPSENDDGRCGATNVVVESIAPAEGDE